MIRFGSSYLLLTAMVLISATAMAGSETPPSGASWKRDFGQAHREALKTEFHLFYQDLLTASPCAGEAGGGILDGTQGRRYARPQSIFAG